MFDEETNSSQDELKPPQHERWAPLGAAASPDPVISSEPKSFSTSNTKLHQLENEKEELQQSLFSLTSRFAQIQFRLHQIMEADNEEKPRLLQELDELANRGCIDNSIVSEIKQEVTTEETEQKKKQEAIIQELKHQLDDLENFAFQQGRGGVPQSIVLEKQQIILEQLMSKLNLRVQTEELAQASVEDLKKRVDNAVAEIVNPGIIKEKLVDHLQTQIQDLERFVEFLQVEVGDEGEGKRSSGSVPNASVEDRKKSKESLAMLKRLLSIVQVFTITQLSCGTKQMQKETIEESAKGNIKRLLDNLKKAVNNVKALTTESRFEVTQSCDESEGNTKELFYGEMEDNETAAVLSVDNELTQVVRKELCPAISNLMAHGLVVDATVSPNAGLVTPISCLLPRKLNSALGTKPLHPWELCMEYYGLKNGAQVARSPSRMLTRSFGLDNLVSSGSDHYVSVKHSFLEAINMVINDHNPLKRSYDVMLKALICLGLNSGKLPMWIRLIMKTSSLISDHYTDYSYVAQTGFEGALTILSRLNSLSFNLPVDLAVRPFKNIRDAF